MLASNASTRTKYFELGSRKTARPVVLAPCRRAVGPHDCRASEDHRIASSSARWFTPPPTKARDKATPRLADGQQPADASVPAVSVSKPAHRRLRPCFRARPWQAADRGAQARRRPRSIPVENVQSGPRAGAIGTRACNIRSEPRVPRAAASRPTCTTPRRAIQPPARRLIQKVVVASCGGLHRPLVCRSVPVQQRICGLVLPSKPSCPYEIWTFSKEEASGGRAPRTAETFPYPPVKSMA